MSLSFFVCIFAKNGVSCLKRKKGTALTIQKKKVIGYSLFTIFLWASAYPLTKIAQTHFTVVPLAFQHRREAIESEFKSCSCKSAGGTPNEMAFSKSAFANPFFFCVR